MLNQGSTYVSKLPVVKALVLRFGTRTVVSSSLMAMHNNRLVTEPAPPAHNGTYNIIIPCCECATPCLSDQLRALLGHCIVFPESPDYWQSNMYPVKTQWQ